MKDKKLDIRKITISKFSNKGSKPGKTSLNPTTLTLND